jgi:hypothetical protein
MKGCCPCLLFLLRTLPLSNGAKPVLATVLASQLCGKTKIACSKALSCLESRNGAPTAGLALQNDHHVAASNNQLASSFFVSSKIPSTLIFPHHLIPLQIREINPRNLSKMTSTSERSPP